MATEKDNLIPADHAETVRGFMDWARAEGRPGAEWVITRAEARVLADRVTELERELAEALTHCRGPMPSPERIAEAHSRLPRDWFEGGLARLANHGVGHFAYQQGPEACYICTLLGLYENERERAERAAELEEKLEWVKHLLPPSQSDELTEWLDRSTSLGDTEVAYVENLSAQEAVYWEARRRGMNLTDKQVGDLLRAAARAGFGGPADGAH